MIDQDTRAIWTQRKLYGGVLLITLVAGVVGGVIVSAFSRQRPTPQDLGNSREILLPQEGLLFKSRDGKLVAKLAAGEGGGSLLLYNRDEKPIITFTGSQFGGGLIGLTSGKGLGAVLQLAGSEEGGSVVLLSQNRGKRVLRLSANDDGGSIEVNGPTGDEAVIIDTEDLGKAVNGRIDVLESMSGKILWTSPVGTPKRR